MTDAPLASNSEVFRPCSIFFGPSLLGKTMARVSMICRASLQLTSSHLPRTKARKKSRSRSGFSQLGLGTAGARVNSLPDFVFFYCAQLQQRQGIKSRLFR